MANQTVSLYFLPSLPDTLIAPMWRHIIALFCKKGTTHTT